MTQPLEENRLYSWSRTPGKPNSSSNFISTKNSNISSSTDSGVGRTPNWNSEFDNNNKFRIYDSNVWPNALSSSELSENPKKLSWDENTNKTNSNFTFGFSSSQWPPNTDITPWGLSRNNSSDFNSHESAKIDNCWTNSIDASNDRFFNRNNSIWATNPSNPESTGSITTSANADLSMNCLQIVDHCVSSKSSKSHKSILPAESDKSEFPSFSAFNSSLSASDMAAIDDLTVLSDNTAAISLNSLDKPADHQTWAQAAGKGLQNALKDDGFIKHEVDEQFISLINRVDGWGSHTVDQSTPWLVDTDMFVDQSDKITSLSSQRARSNVESNVWTNEPPNGVGVWESHYENLGERTSRWGVSVAATTASAMSSNHKSTKPAATVTSGWEIGSMADNSQWGSDRDDSSVWSSTTNVAAAHKQTWPMMASIGKPSDQPVAATTPIGASRNSSSSNMMAAAQRNCNATGSVLSGVSMAPDLNDVTNRHGAFFPNQPANIMANNRMSLNAKSKQQMINVGFRKDDGQNAIFPSSLELNRQFMDMKNCNQSAAMNNHSAAAAAMMSGRADWAMAHDSYRLEPEANTGGLMGSSGPSYLPQSMMMPSNNRAGMKPPSTLMQHMHQMGPARPLGKNTSADNHAMLEKQIIGEIAQLQSKQQDLMQRINGLRSIAGSQAFIQEMNRTLNEVCQQLTTQQTTLKVIQSQSAMAAGGNVSAQIAANGGQMMINSSLVPSRPPQQPSQPDLSIQMSDLKLHKNRMDLWSQGTLPSPNTISPFMGPDKPASAAPPFYNGVIPNGTGGPLQPYSNYNSRISSSGSATAGAPSQQHRQSNQLWQQSRIIHNPASSGQVAAAAAAAAAIAASSSSMVSPDSMLAAANGPLGSEELDLLACATANGGSVGLVQSKSSIDGNSSANNSAITTALSLSQPLSSSMGAGGGRMSSAFSSSRDMSHLSANISEFVPGQPWSGMSYSQRDDPNVTLGAGQRSLLSVTNDHLEKLANAGQSGTAASLIANDVGSGNTGANRLSNNMNGINQRSAMMTYVLIRDLPNHINMEMLKNVLTPHSFPGLIHMQTNLASRWVLLHFTSNDEALKAYDSLNNKVRAVVELLPDQEVNQVTRAGGHRPSNGIIEQPMF